MSDNFYTEFLINSTDFFMNSTSFLKIRSDRSHRISTIFKKTGHIFKPLTELGSQVIHRPIHVCTGYSIHHNPLSRSGHVCRKASMKTSSPCLPRAGRVSQHNTKLALGPYRSEFRRTCIISLHLWFHVLLCC
jgi:hypothetical protein